MINNVFSDVIVFIVNLLLLPLQLVLVPIDFLLSKITGIETIPNALEAVIGFVGTLPSFFVSVLGIQPIIFNLIFTIFLLYFTLVPAINGLKRAWSWFRP